MSLLQGLGLQGLQSAFGTTAPPPNNIAAMQQYQNQLMNGYNSQLAQQAMYSAQHGFGALQMPKWIFNGKTCSSVREMADEIWHNDCPEKTHFILKYE